MSGRDKVVEDLVEAEETKLYLSKTVSGLLLIKSINHFFCLK